MGNVSTCTTILLTALEVALVSAGLALLILGVFNLDQCPVEESLPVWMITAGSALLLFALLSVLYAVRSCCSSSPPSSSSYAGASASPEKSRHAAAWRTQQSSSTGFGATLCALACAFVCGGVGVVLLLAWVALWVAGTYLVSAAVGRMRQEELAPHDPVHQTCDVASVAVSMCSVILVWSLLLGCAVWVACALARTARRGGGRRDGGKESGAAAEGSSRCAWQHVQQQQEHHLYDRVASG